MVKRSGMVIKDDSKRGKSTPSVFRTQLPTMLLRLGICR